MPQYHPLQPIVTFHKAHMAQNPCQEYVKQVLYCVEQIQKTFLPIKRFVESGVTKHKGL